MTRKLCLVVRTFVLTCDRCAEVFPEEPIEFRYASAALAWADAMKVHGWARVAGQELCGPCACAVVGHRWPDWEIRIPNHPGELITPVGLTQAPFRFCPCGALEVFGEGVIGDGC